MKKDLRAKAIEFLQNKKKHKDTSFDILEIYSALNEECRCPKCKTKHTHEKHSTKNIEKILKKLEKEGYVEYKREPLIK
jgi:DNA-binding IscR family transcriptional regulator